MNEKNFDIHLAETVLTERIHKIYKDHRPSVERWMKKIGNCKTYDDFEQLATDLAMKQGDLEKGILRRRLEIQKTWVERKK
jgi:hypothetical protein